MKLSTYILSLLLFISCAHETLNTSRQPSSKRSKQRQTLKARFKSDFTLSLSESKDYFNNEIFQYIRDFNKNGSWKDINYDLDDNKFTPGFHLIRMERLARAYSSPGHKYFENQNVFKIISKAFDFWTSKDIYSYNWWHNTIGIPMKFTRVMILLEKKLGRKRIRDGVKILDRAKISKTGQNRLWYSEIVFIRSLFDSRTRYLKKASAEFYNLITEPSLSYSEGIQADLSFHQHGPLIYNGGYGSKFSLIIARLIKILSETDYQFPKNKVNLYSSFILDSQIWMTRSNKWDYSVTGRELTRKGKKATKLLKVCEIMKDLSLSRQEEFKSCYFSLVKNKSYLRGNKAFWRSDYMVHHRENYFASVRMYSNRLLNNDAPSNGEGLMSHYLADGATYVMRRGDEYEDIFPVWDWNMIPGTTTEIKKLKPAFYEPGNWDAFAHIRYRGYSSFVGQVSNGRVGFSSMDFISNKKYEKVDIRKSYFYTDDAIFISGDKLECIGCNQVVTTVEQKLLSGDVYTLSYSGEIKRHTGIKEYNNLKAIHHDGIIYNFPSPQRIVLSTIIQKGKWSTINGQYNDHEVSKKVFKLYIKHQDVFQYIIQPGKQKEDLEKVFKGEVTTNELYHSYEDTRYKMISFFKKGSISMNDSLYISVNKPCLVLLDTLNEKAFISDPTQELNQIEIKINKKSHRIPLPRFRESGKTVSIDF